MTINPRTYAAYDLLHRGILALSRAEAQGIRVDLEYIERRKRQLTRRIERLEQEFKETKFYHHWEHTVKGKVNINSNTQLAHFLYGIKKLEPARLTPSGQGSTDEDALQQLNIPELNDLLEMRKLKKVRDTYLDAFAREQVDGYIHPFFNLHLVVSFRSSSDSPNFQNIPKKDEESMQMCRQALYPRPGHQLLEVDFGSIEVKVAACYNKDTNLIKYIKNPASDMHADMARQIFVLDKLDKSLSSHQILRQAAKNGFVFPEFYGDYYKNCAVGLCEWGKLPQTRWSAGQGIAMSKGTLSDHLISKGIRSFDRFTEHLKKIEDDFWGNRFGEYAEWKERWWKVYKKHGYITTLTGFTCSGIMDRKQVVNYPVQGSAFHCLLWSLIQIDRTILEEKWDTRIVSQIHDSVILDVNPSELNHVKKVIHRITTEDLLKEWDWICVPMSIEMELSPIDQSWAEKQKIEI